ncbi:MAG TPA: (deoxy)nucleoside triphosphate pyrophosphohydrolase [Myxococcales bacterium]|jgi:8-oxo-dGTP diphosphatase|nr:(deoxy)nucleoside triphosphate pyrophosphohydrolase [Myxococcales bacterium]
MSSRIRVVAAMLEKDGRYLITQRRPGGTLPLLWEFPGGRVEEGETDEAALARELREEMDIEVQVRGQVMQVHHSYSDYDIDFRVYRCKLVGGEIAHHRVHDHRWVLPTDLDKYQFPAADEKTLSLLLDLQN